MSTSAEPTSNGNGSRPEGISAAPADVVRGFLSALAAGDADAALDLVADDIVYENVSLPTIRGKQRLGNGARAFYRRGVGFDVRIHRIAESGSVVLTERTDAITIGGYRSQFWVCGVFEVEAGQITLWRDYFDWAAILAASLRGLIGTVLPSARARFDSLTGPA